MILTSSNLFETLETDPVSGYCVHIVTHAKKKRVYTCTCMYGQRLSRVGYVFISSITLSRS